jgi:Protein of unknown function (DUF4240)
MWGAAWHIMQGWCSDDGFWYFQPWLVGLGQDTFEAIAANPDALAETPQIRRLVGRPTSDWSNDEWPEWESLNYDDTDRRQARRPRLTALLDHLNICSIAVDPWEGISTLTTRPASGLGERVEGRLVGVRQGVQVALCGGDRGVAEPLLDRHHARDDLCRRA